MHHSEEVEVYGGGVEECGGKGGGVWWEGWMSVVGLEVLVGGAEECGRAGGMWWEG